jgi:2-polyprenyl-3-methyl-5-hydroxy-6-metoxy-1,4-benzoquinol methylase
MNLLDDEYLFTMASDFEAIWDHTYTFANGQVHVKVHEDLDAGLGGTLFDGSVALTEYLETLFLKEGSRFFEEKRWIELGAGCGFPGLLAGKFGGHVVLTDVPGQAVDLLDENIQLNSLSGSVKAQGLDWFSEADMRAFRGQTFDCILAADTIYSVEAVEPFLKVCAALCHDNSFVILAHPRARVKDASAKFWREVGQYFNVEKVDASLFVKGWTSDSKQFLHPEQGLFLLYPRKD